MKLQRKNTTFKTFCLLLITVMLVFSPSASFGGTLFKSAHTTVTPLHESPIQDIVDLAQKDHIALLKLAIQNYDRKITDYNGKFHKQERIGKKLGKKQVISFKFRQEPFSVSMTWDKNAGTADRLLYIEGLNDNKMIVHPTGLLCWIKSVKLAPSSKKAMSKNLRPCNMFGFRRNMIETLKVYEQAARNGHLTSRCSELKNVDGRQYITIERILPENEDYPTAKLSIKFDLKYLLPVEMTTWDWHGQLTSRYAFTDIQFNPGLKDTDFDPKTNNL